MLTIIAACFTAACESVTHPLWWMPEEPRSYKGFIPYVPPEYRYYRYKYHHLFPPEREGPYYDLLFIQSHKYVGKSVTKEDFEIKDYATEDF